MPKKYEVEKITDWNFKKNIENPTFYDTEYKVKWKNYREPTIEPLVNLILDNGYLNDDLKTFILNNTDLLQLYQARWGLQETYKPDKSLSDYDQELLRKFNKTWEIEKIVDIQVTTIEDLINKKNIPIPDFIKLDIQGTEYEALEGMGEFLNNLTGIELETTLKPVYKNQKTFDEIFKFLDSKGFALRDIQHQGPFEGELIELNAFFSKKPSDPTTNIYKLKLWEFISEIESPPHLAQIQLQSNMQNHELWSEITEFHKSRLFGEL